MLVMPPSAQLSRECSLISVFRELVSDRRELRCAHGISASEAIVQNETRDKSRHSSKQTPVRVLELPEWRAWEDRVLGALSRQEAQGRLQGRGGRGAVPEDKDMGRMVGMERDGGEGRGNSSLENGRAWQFKSHGVEGIGIFSPTAQRFWGVQLNPHHSASLGRGSQGLRTQLVREGEKGSQTRRPGLIVQLLEKERVWGGGVQVPGIPAGCRLPCRAEPRLLSLWDGWAARAFSNAGTD